MDQAMTSTPPSPIGDRIRALRQELGLTQEKFAAKLGVTFPTVNRWENNRTQPSPLALEKLAAIAQQLGDRGQTLWARDRPQSRL
jgi:putative transcriptional regulator